MKIMKSAANVSGLILALGVLTLKAQVPVANFTISPNPVCSGAIVQITDLSTNSPTSWSYTLSQVGPGPNPPPTSTIQNPTVTYNNAGTFTISLIATNASGASIVVTHTISVLGSPVVFINPANQTSCVGGNPVALSCLSGAGNGTANIYSWSNGMSTQSITVSPSVTTTYTCVVTGTNGCSTTRTATVNISTPSVVVNSNPISICPGSSSTLTANGQGPGPWTYLWSTSATNNNIVTNVAGVYNVTVTNANNCSGTQSYSLGTSATLSLTATSNPSILCAGNTATLHVSGASSYMWSTGSSAVNTSVNPTSTTTYTVQGTLGTCAGTTSITLNVSNTPTITIVSTSQSLCAGNSATLIANGATSYTWSPGAVLGSSLVINPLANTTFSARGINPGCPPRTATMAIVVLPAPVLLVSSSASIACAGEAIALSASGASTYVWDNGAITAVIIVYPGVNTTYTVTGTGINGCSTVSQITQNVSDCAGLNAGSTGVNNRVVYPNPNNGEFKITSGSNTTMEIINEMGTVIKSLDLNEENYRCVNVCDLEAGVYFLVGQDMNSSSKQKIIVIK